MDRDPNHLPYGFLVPKVSLKSPLFPHHHPTAWNHGKNRWFSIFIWESQAVGKSLKGVRK